MTGRLLPWLALPLMLALSLFETKAQERPPLPKSSAEQRVLEAISEMERGRLGMSVSHADGRLLRVLAESIGATRIVEIGTYRGYSGLWLSLALIATGGRLTTYDIDPNVAAEAADRFRRAGVDGFVTVVVGDAHREIEKLQGPIDMVFIDADKSGYFDYLQKLKPMLRPGGLIVAHNMRYPRPDPRYLDAVTQDPAFETVFLHMESAGIGVTMKKR